VWWRLAPLNDAIPLVRQYVGEVAFVAAGVVRARLPVPSAGACICLSGLLKNGPPTRFSGLRQRGRGRGECLTVLGLSLLLYGMNR
jgi:hypothetical protein